MLLPFLQTQANPFPGLSPDSLAVKHEALTDILQNTPPDQLVKLFFHEAIQFGFKVLVAFIIYIIGAWIIRLVRRATKKSFLRRHTEPTMASFVDSLLSITLWVILIFITIGTLGVNTTSIAAILAAGGVAIGMALNGTLQNFAGGLMILAFKPFKVGDVIEAQGWTGIVSEVTIVSTRITTRDNRTVILPNGALFNGTINNMNIQPLRRVDLSVNVAYGTEVDKVKEAILEIIGSNELFLDNSTPGASDPFVALLEMKDSSIEFTVRVWVNTDDYWPARFWLTENIYTQLPEKYGINFPFPQMDIHIKH